MSYAPTPTLADIKKKPRYNIERGKYGSYIITPEIEAEFRRLFPKNSNRKLMELFGISFSTVQRLKREYGLKKNMKVIKHKQAMQIKRACIKSGYYESLKGRRPSQACMEASKKRWADESPAAYIKRTMPKVHRRRVKNATKAREENRQKDRRRLELGLDQKTKLHLPQFIYTHSQSVRRHYALKRGYIIGDMRERFGERYIIYYDDDTKRGAIFEQRAMKDGFTFKKLA